MSIVAPVTIHTNHSAQKTEDHSMRFLKHSIIYTFILFPIYVFAQTESFNADSAYTYIEHLSVTIGPRLMGSANERTALNWTVNKFTSFGADTAYVMVITEAITRRRIVNTNSGVAVGIFRGETDSTIVIGGHIDSSGKEIPGANDNASGTASVIELARLWGQRPRHYTMVFTAFGGEEQGLIGSKFFVDNYPDLGKVSLMLQLDMVASDEELDTMPETKSYQAPRWLVEDAFAIDRALGINRLQYSTHFSAINNGFTMTGSDHVPFLDKNIPAIDFTAGKNSSPIHTPRDRIEYLSKPALEQTGRFADSLLTKYQTQGIPAERTGEYMLWHAFGALIFVPAWSIVSIDILALLLGIGAFLHSRKNRIQIDKKQGVRFSGLKLFLMMVIIAIFTQLGEAAIQLIKGLRYPWLVHLDKYLWLAGLCTIAGFWIALQFTRNWHFSPDPYVYTKRALTLLFVLVVLLGMASVRLALYPALTLVTVSIAIFIANPAIKFTLSCIAPLPMLRLMFHEAFPLIARTSVASGFAINNFGFAFLYSAIITLILVIWYLPAMYAISYTLIVGTQFKSAAKYLRRPLPGLFIAVLVFGYGGYVYSLPAYNDAWRAAIQVNANYDMRSGENKLQLIGNEYFRKVTVRANSLDKEYDERVLKDDLAIPFTADWLDITGHEELVNRQTGTINLDWTLSSTRPWLRTIVTIRVDTLGITEVDSDLIFKHQDEQVTFTWFPDPPETLRVAASFKIPPGAKLIREIFARYAAMPTPIEVTAEFADVRYRTIVTYRDTLSFTGTN